ncbi:MAG: hypothetical protein RBU45_12690 [Myxococcota bacterium]|nr:hypothetical protein [Myxococcota bacterium]
MSGAQGQTASGGASGGASGAQGQAGGAGQTLSAEEKAAQEAAAAAAAFKSGGPVADAASTSSGAANQAAAQQEAKGVTGGGGTPAAPANQGGGAGGGAPVASKEGGVPPQGKQAAEGAVQGGGDGSAGDVKGVVKGFTGAQPTEQAKLWPGVGGKVGEAAKGETEKLQGALPEYHAKLEGEKGPQGKAEVAELAAKESFLKEHGGEMPKVKLPPHPPGKPFVAKANPVQSVSKLSAKSSVNEKVGAVRDALGKVPTSDGDVNTSPGAPPPVPQQGATDPAKMQEAKSQGEAEANAAATEAKQKVVASPGPELVRPQVMDELNKVPGLTPPQIKGTTQQPGMEEYLGTNIPEDVRNSYDQMYGPEIKAHLQAGEKKVEEATQKRDAEQQAELNKAEAENQKLVEKAQQEQETEVNKARGEITKKRQETVAEQEKSVQQLRQDVATKQQAQKKAIESRIQQDEGKIKSEYDKAQSQAENEVKKGEAAAKKKKEEVEKKAQDKSWWEKAVDFVADCVKAVADAVSSIFNAVREAVGKVLDAVKNLATKIIDAACKFVTDAIKAFGDYLKEKINQLLKDRFPGLAKALCDFVDKAVDKATQYVEKVAQGLKDAVAALVDTIKGALDKIIALYQAAVETAMAIVEAAISGDWTKVALKILEAALKLAGISPDEFYALIGKAEDTIKIIINDPGKFIGNLLGAVKQGFGQFQDNFLEHLKNGFVAWLTGQASETGIQMPAEFNLAGIFDIVLQVLGLTKDKLREKAVKHLGEENVEKIEFVWGFIDAAIKGGLAGLWEHVQGYMDGLWDMVVGKIQDWVMKTVVMKAVTKLATMWNPVGAIVQALITAWDMYQFIKNQAQRIMGIVKAIVDSVAAIASGDLSGAAGWIEKTLASAIPVAIDLLASLLGVSGIGKQVRDIITGIQAKVDQAIEKLIEKVKGMFSGKGKDGKKEGEDASADGKDKADGPIGEEVKFQAGSEPHRLWVENPKGGGAPVTMVASTPMTVGDMLKKIQPALSRKDGEGKEANKGVTDADRKKWGGILGKGFSLEKKIAAETAKVKGARAKGEDAKDDGVKALQAQLAEVMGQLLLFEKPNTGEDEKPTQLDLDPNLPFEHPDWPFFEARVKEFAPDLDAKHLWKCVINGMITALPATTLDPIKIPKDATAEQKEASKKRASEILAAQKPASDHFSTVAASLLKGRFGALKGKPNALWSGGEVTQKYAVSKGFTTLESSVAGSLFNGIQVLADKNAWNAVQALWIELSKQYAREAVGKIDAFQRWMGEIFQKYESKIIGKRIDNGEALSIEYHAVVPKDPNNKDPQQVNELTENGGPYKDQASWKAAIDSWTGEKTGDGTGGDGKKVTPEDVKKEVPPKPFTDAVGEKHTLSIEFDGATPKVIKHSDPTDITDAFAEAEKIKLAVQDFLKLPDATTPEAQAKAKDIRLKMEALLKVMEENMSPSELAKKRQEFEGKLGVAAAKHPAALDAATELGKKTWNMVQALAKGLVAKAQAVADAVKDVAQTLEQSKDIGEETRKKAKELLASCGKDLESGFAGAISESSELIEKVLTEGSGTIRERMLIPYNFQETLGKQAMVLDAKEYEEVLKEAGLKKRSVATMKKKFEEAKQSTEKSKHKVLFGAERKTNAEYFDAKADKANEMDAKLPEIPVESLTHPELLQIARAHQKNPKATTKLPADFESMSRDDLIKALKNVDVKTSGKGEPNPLSRSQKQRGAGGVELGEMEAKAESHRGAEYLPWIEGARANLVKEGHKWIQKARRLNMPTKAGISGTTNRFMAFGAQIGHSALPSLRLAILGDLLTMNAHSYHEIMTASRGFKGCTYNPHKSPYLPMLPLNEGELQAIAGGKEAFDLINTQKKKA